MTAPRDAPYIWVPGKLRESLSTPTATFADIFNGLVFRSVPWMSVQNLKFVDLPVPGIIRGTPKIWTVPRCAHAPFSPKFFMGFCSDGLCEHTCQIWIPEIIAIAVLANQSWGKGGRRGSGMVPFERALVSSYRPSIVTFHLSLRVSEILPLLCSSTPLFPTSPLVSPKFPKFPGNRWMAFGLRRAQVLG